MSGPVERGSPFSYGAGPSGTQHKSYSHFNISGSGRTQIGDQYTTVDSNDALSRLPYAGSAPFNSYRRQHDPLCLPGTRVSVLERIYAWIEGPPGPPLYWLNGLAGTGKSTIARTVARKYHDRGDILGTFFFSRGSVDAENAAMLFTTITVQLAASSPAFRSKIGEALRNVEHIEKKSLQDQWQTLILDQISSLSSERPAPTIIIVIDALDECDDVDSMRSVLQLFTQIRPSLSGYLRIFVTSRPELPIRHHFSRMSNDGHETLILHQVARAEVQADICRFFKASLTAIGQERGFGPEWPGDRTIDSLTEYAAGLFVWAATACRFIRQGKRFAKQRLQHICDRGRANISEPERQLDQIYLFVLSSSVSSEFLEDEKEAAYAQLRTVLGTLVVLRENLPMRTLSAMLGLSVEDVEGTIEELHAVLDVTEDETRSVYLHHPSFRDFLGDASRCTNPSLWIDKTEIHQMLVHRCIGTMATNLTSALSMVRERLKVRKQPVQIPKGINGPEGYDPDELKYACQHW